jgi:hypothetical protein
MGYDVTRFVVGDEWVYRLRDDAVSERVRILAVMPKKSSARLDVVFLDDPDGRVENVPGSRLPVLWSKVEAYDVLMADWARLDKVKLDDVESSCASHVFEVLIPEDIAAIGWSQVDDATSIHAATKLEEIIGVPVADIVTRVESFTLNEATVVSPAGTVLIAEAACRANPAQILDKVVEEEAEDRYKCKNGSSRVGLISREKEPTAPEWEYHMYRQFHRPRHELLRQWCGHRAVTSHERLQAAEAENQRLDVLVANLIRLLDQAGDQFTAARYAEEHERDRITPYTVRPIVDRPLHPSEIPVREVRVRGWWPH